VHLDVQAQIALQSLMIHAQKIAGDHRPRVGNHEANIQIMGSFRQLCENIIGGQIQSNCSILDAEGVREFAPQRFERGEAAGNQHQMQSARRHLARKFFANA
jgi:hypothetical protein